MGQPCNTPASSYFGIYTAAIATNFTVVGTNLICLRKTLDIHFTFDLTTSVNINWAKTQAAGICRVPQILRPTKEIIFQCPVSLGNFDKYVSTMKLKTDGRILPVNGMHNCGLPITFHLSEINIGLYGAFNAS